MAFTCSRGAGIARFLAFAAIVALSAYAVSHGAYPGDGGRAYLDKSAPFVGTDVPRTGGIDGGGVVVAVIDTGVDYNHPDLLGWGPDGKVIGGYNFIDEAELPIDTNGHGTQVAGVIAADGHVTGIAPKAKILAYKVSEDGKGVSSDLIIRAIGMAIDDGADIINISLGVNKTNTRIERAINDALDREIFVVAAAGNDGPDGGSIGSPGRNPGTVTVGATYNNLASSLVATLEVDGKQYTAIPMAGSSMLYEPVRAEVVSAGHARAGDFVGIDAGGKILLAERGSVEGEILYFSEKESNSADAGAAALIVYNNKPGIFLGELKHRFAGDGYEPRIPVVSIDRKDGLEIIDMLAGPLEGALHLFYNPDFVAHFSSRGPVSPFYIKPDIVAPGAYINTTQNNAGYNFTSGTSYAAPHVSGAAALLMQKNPGIHHHEIKSLLLTTVKPVADAYGNEFSVNDAGAGRLDIAEAFGARLIIQPPSLVASLSSFEPAVQKELRLKPLEGTLDGLAVSFDGPESVGFSSFLEGGVLRVGLDVEGDDYGDHEARIRVSHGETEYAVPLVIHHTEGSVGASVQGDRLVFDVRHPEEWGFAKVSATNSIDGRTQTATMTPERPGSVGIYGNAEYWIEADILVDGEPHDAFATVTVDSLPGRSGGGPWDVDVPERQIGIMAGIVAAIGAIGLIIRRAA